MSRFLLIFSSVQGGSESKKEKKRKRSRSRSKSGDAVSKKSKSSSKNKRKRSDRDRSVENGVIKSGGQLSDDEGEVKDDPFSPKKENGVSSNAEEGKDTAKKEPLALEELLAKKKAEEAAVTKVSDVK